MKGSRQFFLLHIIPAIFIFLFGYTVISKLADMDSFQAVIGTFPVVGDWNALIAWTTIILEVVIVLLLLFPPVRWVGLYLSFCLMMVFTVYILLMILLAPSLPCACGGIFRGLSWMQHLILNIPLTILTVIGVILERKNRAVVFM